MSALKRETMILIANSIQGPNDSIARLPRDRHNPAQEVDVLFNLAEASSNGQNVSRRGLLSVASLPWRRLWPRSVNSMPSRTLRAAETEVFPVDEPLSSSYVSTRLTSPTAPVSAGLDWRDAVVFIRCPEANIPIVIKERAGGSGVDISSRPGVR